MFMCTECPKIILLGIKWVAVARHGLILWENGATGLRIILKYVFLDLGCIADRKLCIANTNMLHKDSDYMLQRYKLYVGDTIFICCKYKIYMSQRQIYMSQTEIFVC